MRNHNHLHGTDRAEVGIGTLIVFIAMVLVAAVAAAVLIGTSGLLQERASSTGKEATQEVSSNLLVSGVYGYVWSGKIDSLNITTQLAAGAPPTDLTKLVIRYADGARVAQYAYDDANDDPSSGTDWGSIAAGKYGLNWIRSVDGSVSSSTSPPVIRAGDLVEFHVDLGTSDLDNRKSVAILLIPEYGAATPADFTTPATYGSAAYVPLG